jgi:hypothetical protein
MLVNFIYFWFTQLLMGSARNQLSNLKYVLTKTTSKISLAIHLVKTFETFKL